VARQPRKRPPLTQVQQALVTEHLWVAKHYAFKFHRSIFTRFVHELEDLEQVATLGLMEAAVRYDPTKGDFAPFATARTRGAILDYHRIVYGRNGKPKFHAGVSIEALVEDGQNAISFLPDHKNLPLDHNLLQEELYKYIKSMHLTKQEHFVLSHHIKGETGKKIAEQLNVSKARVSYILTDLRSRVDRWRRSRLPGKVNLNVQGINPLQVVA